MIYINGEEVKPYLGDYKPLTIYKGTEKLAGWVDKTINAVGSIPLSDTYNTGMGIKTTGKAMQVQTKTGANVADANVLYKQMEEFDADEVNEKTVDNKECIEFNNQRFRNTLGFKGLNNIKYKENTQYTVRFLAKYSDINTRETDALYFNVYYTDETYNSTAHNNTEGDWIEFRILSDASKTISDISFSFGNGSWWLLDKSSLCIIEGDVTEYPAFVPNSPSPDYPSPVLTSNFTGVKVSSRNIFNVDFGNKNIENKDSVTGSFSFKDKWGKIGIPVTNFVKMFKPNTQYKAIANVTLTELPIDTNSSYNTSNLLGISKGSVSQGYVLKCSSKTEKNNWQLNETKKLESTFKTPDDITNCSIWVYNYISENGTHTGEFQFKNMTIVEVYPEITMTLDNESGNYYLDGITTQDGTPSIDNPIEPTNTYATGTYQTVINDKTYVITLSNDLMSVGNVADRLWFDVENMKAWIEKKINCEDYDISSSNGKFGDNTYQYYRVYNLVRLINSYDDVIVMSNVFKGVSRNYAFGEEGRNEEVMCRGMNTARSIAINIFEDRFDTINTSNINNLLKEVNAKVYYILEDSQMIEGQYCYEEKYEYTQYREPLEYSITTQNGFPGLPNGISDSIEIIDGVLNYIQRIGKRTYKGTENIIIATDDMSSSTNIYYSDQSSGNIADLSETKLMCNYLKNVIIYSVDNIGISYEGTPTNKTIRFRVPFQDATEFKSWLATLYEAGNPLEVYYVLQNPITTPISEMKTLPQGCSVNIEADMDLEMEVDFKQMDND